MRRRLLVISKEPEFDTRNEVVLGQCEPFTSGWYLELIEPTKARERLAFGTYTDLRKIQDSCATLDDTELIKKRVKELKQFLQSAVTKTIPAVRDERENTEVGDATKLLDPIGARIPTQSPGGLLFVDANNGVLIATVVQPDRADDLNYLKAELLTLLDCRPRAVVMDFGRVPSLSMGSFKEIAGMHARFKESGSALALCNLPRDLKKQLNGSHDDKLQIFDTQASALAALKS